jgi:hypothetical protein
MMCYDEAMDPQSIDWKYLFETTRARVYLLWAALVFVGFVATHYYQDHNVMYVWTVLSIIGLGYMVRVMPMRVKLMQQIFGAWVLPIIAGMLFSGSLFYIHTAWAANAIGHLGAYWLFFMAAGYILNGIVDPPSRWYWIATGMNIVAGAACLVFDSLVPGQYLYAAIIGAWSMLNLWIFRS